MTVADPSRLGRRFSTLVLATASSGLGNGVVAAAFPLLASSLTSNAVLIVGVTIAGYLPWLLFGLAGGVIGDRYRARRTVVWVEGVRTIVVLAFAVGVATGHRSLALIYVVVFLISAGDTIFTGVLNALVPRLAPPARLPHANAVLLTAQTSSENAVGPAVGGAVYVAAASVPFALDSASFLLSGVLTFLAVRDLPASTPSASTTFRTDLRAGLYYFRESDVLPLLLVVVTGFAAAQAMVIGPLVLFATRTLHMTSTGFGLLLGVSSLGNVIGSLLAGRIVARYPASRILAGAGLTIVAAYLAAGLAPNAIVATVALTVEAIAVAVGVVAHITLRQKVLEPTLLGRIGNLFRTATMGVMPVGALLGGVLAQSLGLRAPLIAAAALQLLTVCGPMRLLSRRTSTGPPTPAGLPPA